MELEKETLAQVFRIKELKLPILHKYKAAFTELGWHS